MRVTSQPRSEAAALCAKRIPEAPDVASNQRDETCWHGVAFRTAISIELTMSEGVASAHPLRL